MWILGLSCIVGLLVSIYLINSQNLDGGSDATAGMGCMIQIIETIFAGVVWLLIFFGIAFFAK